MTYAQFNRGLIAASIVSFVLAALLLAKAVRGEVP